MKQYKFFLSFVLFVFSAHSLLYTQNSEPDPFDFGKMWTFENPPKEWFEEAYRFTPEESWWDDVRKSSLRFATWCSASFVSPNGLIMTNHHCSRDEAIKIQQLGEQFERFGFYAETLEEERRAPGLFVEQLIRVADITDQVLTAVSGAENEAHEQELTQVALQDIEEEYRSMEAWEDLRIQTVSFYSGGMFSIYGYKRYDDVRLVFLPELEVGFFGGDPDNFTYPRYNLDCSFWRIYDESGNPLNSTDFYFKFNPEGVIPGEAVFVIGNPGSTERYRTVAQLQYDRQYRYPQQYKFLENRYQLLQDIYEINQSEELLGLILNISNSLKANSGIIDGLFNEELFGRKVQMEQKIKSSSDHPEYWNELAELTRELHPHAWAFNHLNPVSLRGGTLMFLHELHDYQNLIDEDSPEEEIAQRRSRIIEFGRELDSSLERQLFRMLMTELEEDVYREEETINELLDGRSVAEYVDYVFEETALTDSLSAEELLSKNRKVKRDKDPFLKAARVLIPRYQEAREVFQSSAGRRKILEANIVNEVFKVYGNSLPPDATFTLRISDGVIKGYNYNGTEAPYKTTYFGLYDRYYSNDREEPWSMPEKWLNPPMELLKAPLNFISTNDIIGGNSGSPVINRDKEVIGLVFDGNIESLPGNFIFDDEYNRTISVHTAGMLAALKYIFQADRLVKELMEIQEVE